MTAERDPRDVAIDSLVTIQNALSRFKRTVDEQVKVLQGGDKPADRRKYVCPAPSCGIRFYREDQMHDHVELIHRG